MKKLILFAFILVNASVLIGQSLTGVKTVGAGGDYLTLAAAIADLNANGVGSGGVTFNITAGHTETFSSPTAGLITATGTSANPILFQKSGIGANPVIKAGTGTSTTTDGIIKIAGGDYITFDGIDLIENPVNTDPTTQMEWGYALVKKQNTAPFDGCQYVTIRNCAITLNKSNTASVGIYSGNHIAASTTSLTITAVTDAMNNCKFFNNSISNAYSGIQLRGYAAPSPYTLYNTNNEIGTDGSNTISNFGGSSSESQGIYSFYHRNLKVANNLISGGTGTSSPLYGIFTSSGASVDIYSNTVTIVGGGTSAAIYAIRNSSGNPTFTSNIYDNTVTNCSYPTATNANFWGIFNDATPATLNLYSNSVNNNTLPGTGNFTGIFAGSPTNLNMYDNTVYNNLKTGPGTLYCMRAGTSVISLHDNIVHSNTISTTGTVTAPGIIYGYYNTGPLGLAIYNNQIYDLSVSGSTTSNSSTVYGISSDGDDPLWWLNQIWNLSVTTAGSGTIYGMFRPSGVTIKIDRNTISGLTACGASGFVSGIYIAGGTTATISNNMVYGLDNPAVNALNSLAGIYIAGGTVINAYYNTVYLNSTSTGALFGSAALYASTTPTVNLRNNILVNTSTPNGSGLTAVYRRSNATLTSYGSASNNNCFYAGTPSTTNVIFYDGTNSCQTLINFQALVTPRDNVSVTEMPPFLNTTSPMNLHINPAIPTWLESGGSAITGFDNDYDNEIRQGSSGYSGNGTAPDIGADEFEGKSVNCQVKKWALPKYENRASPATGAPSNGFKHQRIKYLITPDEMNSMGFQGGCDLTSIGFAFAGGPSVYGSITGTFKIWLQNTSLDFYPSAFNDWSVTGQQVYGGTYTIPGGPPNTEFDIEFQNKFPYTGAGIIVAMEFDTEGSFSFPPAQHYGNTFKRNFGGAAYSNKNQLNTLEYLPSRPATRFGVCLHDILWVSDIYCLKTYSEPFPMGGPVKIRVENVTGNTESFWLHMVIKDCQTGNELYHLQKYVAYLSGYSAKIVEFGQWITSLPEQVCLCGYVTKLPNDNYQENDTLCTIVKVNETGLIGYLEPLDPIEALPTKNSGSLIYGLKLELITDDFQYPVYSVVTSIMIAINKEPSIIGSIISGYVLDSLGVIVAQSAPYTISANDTGNIINLGFSNPPVISNSEFYAGLAQLYPTENVEYIPLGVVPEYRPRGGTFYTFPLTGGEPTESTEPWIYMMGAKCAPLTECDYPTGLGGAFTGETTAQLDWTSYSGLSNIEYYPSGHTFGEGTFIYGVSSPYTLIGLTPDICYDFYVQDDCGLGSASAWIGPFRFCPSAVYPCPEGSVPEREPDIPIWGNGAGTNPYGFNALPGGYRNYNYSFNGLGQSANFWSSNETSNQYYAWDRELVWSSNQVRRVGSPEGGGNSVRCIKDSPTPCGNQLDYAGQTYRTVQIANGPDVQCWMAENLNVGTMLLSNIGVQNNNLAEKYCYDDDPNNCTVYGGLYHWDEMMQYDYLLPAQGICPTGWHIPSDEEWCTLTRKIINDNVDCNFVGFSGTIAGQKMKSTADINGGCWGSNPPFQYKDINCGEGVCGRINDYYVGDTPMRDADWYKLDVPGGSPINPSYYRLIWEVTSEFVSEINVITKANDCNHLTYAYGTISWIGTDPANYVPMTQGTERYVYGGSPVYMTVRPRLPYYPYYWYPVANEDRDYYAHCGLTYLGTGPSISVPITAPVDVFVPFGQSETQPFMLTNSGSWDLGYNLSLDFYESGAGVISCTPIPGKTGSCTSTVTTQSSFIKADDDEIGYACFDISSIPAGAIITGINFFGYVNSNNWPSWSITSLPYDPAIAGPEALFPWVTSNFSPSDAYSNNQEPGTLENGWISRPLSQAAVADLQAALAQGWFSIGITDFDFSSSYYINFDGWNETHFPYLSVSYTMEPNWLTVDGASETTDSIPPGESKTLLLEYNSAGLPIGTYHANMKIRTNEYQDTLHIVPVTMHVGYSTINLSVFLEGLFNPSAGQMNKAQDEYGDKFPGTVADKIQLRIADPFSPYSVSYIKDNIDLNQDGSCSFTIPRIGLYYLVVKHRNSIETWSANPVDLSSNPVYYDFTTSSSQAYGDNMREFSGVWAIWSGDVNQDGIVDAGDMNPVDNASTAVTFGYVSEDVNGDGIVDAGDLNIVDNNSTAIIMAIVP
jgi:uncharacterized protein (TIGR02145 family)